MDIGASSNKPLALSLLASERPRNVTWKQAAGLLFGDWGTSRLYVLGLAFFYAQRQSIYLIAAMSVLILAVGWAYSNICRIYPDGGGVYTAAKQKSRTLAVIGALLLFADYTVTASLSAADGFRYFGVPESEHLFSLASPGLWAIIAIAAIGLFNLMGPKHTGAFALAAAVGMVIITLLVTFGALPKVHWTTLPSDIGPLKGSPKTLWFDFVSIVLALSGVEAIANLTGVMKRPVGKTSNKAIWTVALEVAIFNILLGLCMVAIHLPDDALRPHRDDMMSFLAYHYLGPVAKLLVGILGGLLLLSAANTAITDMISIQYLMARDGELPGVLQGLNRFGVPWLPAIIAASVPCLVLVFEHDVEKLAALYAIGVVGAVAINVTLCAAHPRLRRLKRKIPMFLLGFVLLAIWVSLAFDKRNALIFVAIVMAVGLTARAVTKLASGRAAKPSLLRQAIMAQLTPDALARPKLLLGTYGSDSLARPALMEAKRTDHALAVCFIRQVNLSYKYDGQQGLTIDTDPAALRTFAKFLDMGHGMGVSVLPIYDSGPDAAELMAENAAVYGCEKILIGTSRQGGLYHLLKGHFQQRLEQLLPPEIPVEVISPDEGVPADDQGPVRHAQTH
ncbi:MAG TPA: APC family permease [Tepidisphaeraceae bacterium]|nr:APC family permease [Tepidisphaeraceae bacterium]